MPDSWRRIARTSGDGERAAMARTDVEPKAARAFGCGEAAAPAGAGLPPLCILSSPGTLQTLLRSTQKCHLTNPVHQNHQSKKPRKQ